MPSPIGIRVQGHGDNLWKRREIKHKDEMLKVEDKYFSDNFNTSGIEKMF
jgi:hypothetical protein